MASRATVRRPGQPDREISLRPGAIAEVLPSVRLTGAEVPGLVLEVSNRPARVDGRRIPGGERRLLRPGQSVEVGSERIVVGWEDPGTAAGARAILLSALRGKPPDAGPELHAVEGPEAGRRFRLRPGVLGRGAASAIRLDDPCVSRNHARLDLEGERVTVRDLGSRNGLWLGGVRVAGPRPLVPGEELRLGRTVLALGIVPPPSSETELALRTATRWRARTALLAAAAAAGVAALLLS
ncbi:MAG: FHA domain-containing protein [Deltaproteobacteria bacterium]